MSISRQQQFIFSRKSRRGTSGPIGALSALPQLHRRLLLALVVACLGFVLWPGSKPVSETSSGELSLATSAEATSDSGDKSGSPASGSQSGKLAGEISLFSDNAVIHDISDLAVSPVSEESAPVEPAPETADSTETQVADAVTPAEPAEKQPAQKQKAEQTQVEQVAQENAPVPAPASAEPDPENLTELPELNEPTWRQYVVAQGDNLTLIFKKLGLPTQTMYQVLRAEGKEKPLTRLRPGQPIDYQLDDAGTLLSLKVEVDKTNSWLFTVNQSGDFTREELKREGEMVRGTASGVINGSFWVSAKAAGLAPGQIDYFSNIFQWRVDFSRDLRKGDTFSVIFEEEVLDGEETGRGQILAALLNNKGKEYMVFRHEDGKYYDLQGNSMSNAFLRYPVDGTYRISSHFNPRRKHPVTGRISPHNGTDFATPTGTPVLSAGSGTVIKSAYNKYSGNYIVIRHNNQYATKYLHLSKKMVKKGQRVQLGQKIGLSGNTGRSTGPHLHYEFHVNNRPVNAMKVKLPMSASLPKSELTKFRELNQPLLAQLEQNKDLLLADR